MSIPERTGMKQNNMKIIGITGGVGAGKTEVLAFIRENSRCKIVYGDEIGNLVKLPGEKCYEELVSLLGKEVLLEDGTISREKMAAVIFADKQILQQVNALIHPAVKEYIRADIAVERQKGEISFYFIEAALLIEDGYDAICDEFWYISTREEIRRARLKESRHYSDEKISQIMSHQQSEDAFCKACRVVIDNSGTLQDTWKQIKMKLEELESGRD